jgi:hypothetical protein
MASVESSPIKPPNASISNGNVNSCGPMGRSASDVRPPNAHLHDGNAANGFMSLGKGASPVHVPDHRFNVANAKMPQPPSVLQPGPGAIPTNPFMSGDGTTTSLRIPDRAGKSVPK